jgi:hypothetical protein
MLELPPHHGFGIQAVRRHLARQVHIVRGGDNLLINGDEAAHDAHCGRCGSLLYSVAGAFVHVAIGTLIDDLSIRPAAHIFVGSKAPWFTITDDLPQYVGHVTEPDPCGKTWRRRANRRGVRHTKLMRWHVRLTW